MPLNMDVERVRSVDDDNGQSLPATQRRQDSLIQLGVNKESVNAASVSVNNDGGTTTLPDATVPDGVLVRIAAPAGNQNDVYLGEIGNAKYPLSPGKTVSLPVQDPGQIFARFPNSADSLGVMWATNPNDSNDQLRVSSE